MMVNSPSVEVRSDLRLVRRIFDEPAASFPDPRVAPCRFPPQTDTAVSGVAYRPRRHGNVGTIAFSDTFGAYVLSRWQFWTSTLLAVLAAVVMGYAMMLLAQNRAAQAQLAQRAQFIQQSVQLEPLYREVAKALADLSVRNQDRALGDLLASQGITVNTAQGAGSSNPPPRPENGERP
jgi:hypothetical protein